MYLQNLFRQSYIWFHDEKEQERHITRKSVPFLCIPPPRAEFPYSNICPTRPKSLIVRCPHAITQAGGDANIINLTSMD